MTELWPFRKGQYPDRVTGRILARRLFGRDNFAFIDPLRYDARCASLDEAFRQLVTEVSFSYGTASGPFRLNAFDPRSRRHRSATHAFSVPALVCQHARPH